jgi:hypothetical protein
MKKIFAVAMLIVSSSISSANASGTSAPFGKPAYLVGFQTLDLLGNGKECFVEAKYSADSGQIEVRSILTSPDEGNELALGPVQADYTINADPTKNGYYFSTSVAKAPVNEFLLVAVTKSAPSDLSVSFYHAEEDHYDFATCDNLAFVSGTQLLTVEEKFSHFDEILAEEHEELEGEGHDHEHGHSH